MHRAMRKYGIDKFKIELLHEYADLEQLREAEIETIAGLRAAGRPLYNLADGGQISPASNPVVAAKISRTLTGRKSSLETRRKQSEALRGRICSDETRAKLSKAHKGRKWSDEHLANVRAARARERGRKLPKEWVDAFRYKLKGRKRSPDAIAKGAATHKGMKRSAAAIANMIKAQRLRRSREKEGK